MGRIVNKKTGEGVNVSDADAVAAVASGEWESADGVTVQGQYGSAAPIDPTQLENRSVMDPSLRFQTVEERNELERQQTLQQDFGGAGDKALTLGAGIASGATLGLTDLLGGEDAAARAEANPGWRTGGVIAGAIGGALLSGGAGGAALAATPAALATRAGAAVGRGVAARIGEGVAAQAVGMAAEGALYGAGQAFGEVALRDPELSAEAVLEAVGPGALMGGIGGLGTGVVFGGIGKVATKLSERSSVVGALDMASPAGKAYASTVAESHTALDDIGKQVITRNGAVVGDAQVADDMVNAAFGQVHRGVRDLNRTMENAFEHAQSLAYAESKPIASSFDPLTPGGFRDFDEAVGGGPKLLGDGGPVGPDQAPMRPAVHVNNLRAAHDVISKHMAGAAERGELGIAGHERVLGKLRKEVGLATRKKLQPGDPLWGSIGRYESALREAGKRFGVDVDAAVAANTARGTAKLEAQAAAAAAEREAQFATANADEAFYGPRGRVIRNPDAPASVSHEYGPTPISDAREAVYVTRAHLDQFGDLTPELLKRADVQAAVEEYAAASKELVKHLAGENNVGDDLLASLNKAREGVGKAGWANIAGEASTSAATRLVKLRSAAHEAFGVGPNGKLTGSLVARVLRGSKEDFLPALAKLDDYYSGVKELAKHTDDLAALNQFEANLADMAEGLATKSGLDPKALTMTQVAAALGVAELPDFEGPVDNMLKYAVMAAVLGGRGLPGRVTRGLGYNLRRQMFTRGLMGMATHTVGSIPGVSGVTGAAVRGATAAASYNLGGRVYDNLLGAVVNTSGVENAISSVAKKVATGVKGVPKALPGLVTLSGMISTDDNDKEPADDHEAFVRIQDTLSRFIANPQGANMTIYEALRPLAAMHPVLADEMEVKTMAKYAYAYDKMPKDPGTMTFMGKSLWKPTDRQLYTFAADLVGVFAPTEAIDGIADGVIPPQAAEAIRATNPAIFRHLQSEIMANADAIRENGDFDQLIALGVAFDVPLHPMSDPRYTAWKQQHWAEHTAEQQDAMANAPNAGAKSEPEPLTDAQQMLA